MPLRIPNVPVDADELDILYADPQSTTRGEKAWSELGFKLLKTVVVANLTVTGGKHIIPLAKGEDEAGRAFDVVAAKTINDIRYTSKRGGFDYNNRAPFTSGKVKETFFVGEKGARIELAKHLYDPDGRPTKLEILANGVLFGQDNVPVWAQLEGTALVVDASVERAETTVAVRLTDEKGVSAVLDVTFDVITPDAPGAPGAVEYFAV